MPLTLLEKPPVVNQILSENVEIIQLLVTVFRNQKVSLSTMFFQVEPFHSSMVENSKKLTLKAMTF